MDWNRPFSQPRRCTKGGLCYCGGGPQTASGLLGIMKAKYSRSSRTSLAFLHLRKTGGTTLHDRIAAAFERHEVCPERFGRLQRYSAEELARYQFFSGHYHFDEVAKIPGEKFVFTLLRPPKERILY